MKSTEHRPRIPTTDPPTSTGNATTCRADRARHPGNGDGGEAARSGRSVVLVPVRATEDGRGIEGREGAGSRAGSTDPIRTARTSPFSTDPCLVWPAWCTKSFDCTV